jgi:orotate phosphoribosyltransferase
MASTQDKRRLSVARDILAAGCVTIKATPSFRWASGIQSPIYTDNRLLLGHPKQRNAISQAFLDTIRSKRLSYDVIAGVATSGIPLAAILADRLKKPLVYVRPQPKGHGRGRQVEGNFTKGARVLLIEDLVSTGGSSLAAVKALRKEGARVKQTLAVFAYLPDEMEKKFRAARCELICLSDLDALLQIGRRNGKVTARKEAAARAFLVKLAEQLS